MLVCVNEASLERRSISCEFDGRSVEPDAANVFLQLLDMSVFHRLFMKRSTMFLLLPGQTAALLSGLV